MRADIFGMSKTRPAYTVVQPTQHWRRINGRWYRDTIVRLASGELRLYGIPDADAA